MKLVNQIKRTAADLIIDPADVFTQQSRANQLDTAQEQNGEKSANVSCSGDYAEILEMEYRIAQIHQREKERKSQNHSAQCHSHPQGLIAKAENRVHGVLEELGKRLFGFARSSSGALVIDDCRRKADPCA